MISRRSLFKRLAAFAAVVAIAPQIAFARKIESLATAPITGVLPFWIQTTRWASCKSAAYNEWREKMLRSNPDFESQISQ